MPAATANKSKMDKQQPKQQRPQPVMSKAAPATPKQNAWSKPLKAVPSAPPGLGGPRPTAPSTKAPSEAETATFVALRERYLGLCLNLVGHKVVVHLRDGRQLEGIFHTATSFASIDAKLRNQYVLKGTQTVKATTADSKANTVTPIQPNATVVLDMSKVVSLHCKSIRLQHQVPSSSVDNSFTDTEISKGAARTNDAGLVAAGAAWTTPTAKAGGGIDTPVSTAGTVTPRSTTGLKASIGGWDQFRANKELFNVTASFDENQYTTVLDKNTVDAQKLREAEKLAAEIEKSVSTNWHVAEERNQVVQGDFDEEDRYSGVIREEKAKSPAGKSATVPAATKAPEAEPVAAVQKKTMNYAAAASKKAEPQAVVVPHAVVEAKKKTEPPATLKKANKATPTITTPALTAKAAESKTDVPAKQVTQSAEDKPSTETTSEEPVKETAKEEEKPKSKLNANASSFSFNINAKSFTPGTPAAPPAAFPDQSYAIDPHTGMPLQQYMNLPPHIGQPAMMHMMNPGVRYPYPGMEHHHVPPHQQQQVHSPAKTGSIVSPVPSQEAAPVTEDGSVASGAAISQPQDGEATEMTPQNAPQPYPVHPSQYPAMPPRGGISGYHPQMYPGQYMHPPPNPMYHLPPHRPMYPMPPTVPPNMMRPYGQAYSNAPMPYGYYEDDGNGAGTGGRGGRGGGRGGRGNGRGGRGGRLYAGRDGGRGRGQTGGRFQSPPTGPAHPTDADTLEPAPLTDPTPAMAAGATPNTEEAST
ncbi:predicted protein [Phaeodactylum tricornutum CCAP 1055/1]|uniref:LsmAD domain-containing protein n=1 Tax=Phaeodactylum tricornutum (strain CCAP 1055/1) TaxID=556484 RepID=B7FW14_PHATC|nr:predicted protein [Phaeodactylum tricornutum CCAP 1055/1]EEC49503.1 predicted protein [Phaeodactylum tricornutum CCAP 1055/1]|eukprot:XP_002178805.1 predicted protein [Phaeodactylum tricornutum CCAP 1055/1]